MYILTAAVEPAAGIGMLIPLFILVVIVAVGVLAIFSGRNNRSRPQQPWIPQQNVPPQIRPQVQPPHPGGSLEDQLIALQGMVEKGLITQEDYDAKKKQLLGL